MRRLFLLLTIYGIALSISMEIRPIFFPPPDSLKDAKDKLIGTWSCSDEYGNYNDYGEIEFHPDWSYTLRTKFNDEEWKELNGYYELDTVRDTATQNLLFKVSSITPRMNLYFKTGDKFYANGRRTAYTKNWGFAGGFLWILAVPCLLLYLPTRFLWNKVNKWNFNFMQQTEPVAGEEDVMNE